MLLCSPNYLNKTSLPLCVLGELESQSLAFSKQTTVWASPANAGSLDLANEIAATFAGFTISTTDDRPASATHMLLYLKEDTIGGDRGGGGGGGDRGSGSGGSGGKGGTFHSSTKSPLPDEYASTMKNAV